LAAGERLEELAADRAHLGLERGGRAQREAARDAAAQPGVLGGGPLRGVVVVGEPAPRGGGPPGGRPVPDAAEARTGGGGRGRGRGRAGARAARREAGGSRGRGPPRSSDPTDRARGR